MRERSADLWRRMALWAEAKVDQAAASSEPWAMNNLRLYQNKASEFWAEHYRACRAESGENA